MKFNESKWFRNSKSASFRSCEVLIMIWFWNICLEHTFRTINQSIGLKSKSMSFLIFINSFLNFFIFFLLFVISLSKSCLRNSAVSFALFSSEFASLNWMNFGIRSWSLQLLIKIRCFSILRIFLFNLRNFFKRVETIFPYFFSINLSKSNWFSIILNLILITNNQIKQEVIYFILWKIYFTNPTFRRFPTFSRIKKFYKNKLNRK